MERWDNEPFAGSEPGRASPLATGLAAVAAVALSACATGAPPQVLDRTAVSPSHLSQTVQISQNPGDDEDPALVRSREGRFHVVWASKRQGGVMNLYTRTSSDGVRWSRETRITNHPDEDLYPSILQARDGSFHMTWFRLPKTRSSAPNMQIWYARSPDGLRWNRPQPISDGRAHAWAPTVYEADDGGIWIVWSSERTGNRELFTSGSRDFGRSWSPPHQITQSREEDDFPHALVQGGERVLVWTRYKPGSARLKYMSDRSAEIVESRSRDGLRWSAPELCLPDDPQSHYLDILPNAFTDLDGRRRYVSFTSNRAQPISADILFLDLDEPGARVRQLTEGIAGEYMGRVAPTGVRGEYLVVWVSTRNGKNGRTDIFARRFRP